MTSSPSIELKSATDRARHPEMRTMELYRPGREVEALAQPHSVLR